MYVRTAILMFFLTFAACKSQGGPTIIECGGTAQFVCPKGMYCDFGEDCGGVDKNGVCLRQPTDCEAVDEPVCGCDGKTYPNPCYARGSGVTVAYEGPCIAMK